MQERFDFAGCTFACMEGKKNNAIMSLLRTSTDLSLISSGRNICNNMKHQMRGGRPLQESVVNRFVRYPANITAQPKG